MLKKLPRRISPFFVIALVSLPSPPLHAIEHPIDLPWKRHVIDNASQGADGTRLADANGDGLDDIVTGWEQGGVTRVYLNPGGSLSKQPWPSVTVGRATSVEDAVFVDLDGDDSLDVVSSCEGKRQALLVHWAPNKQDYLKADQWKTVEIPASLNLCRWMFATPTDVDRDGRPDLLAGGKGEGSQLGWWKISANARKVSQWAWHPIRPMGWLMSLESVDMDHDGDADILFTDRKGPRRGCFWLENDGGSNLADWKEHTVGVTGREAMFAQRVDLDSDGLEDIVVATRPSSLVLCRRLDAPGKNWRQYELEIPATFGNAKAAHAADLDGDGKIEIVFSTENAGNGKFGVGRVVTQGDIFTGPRSFTSISGVDGVKHDLVKLIDMDQDGDLDLLTCEEVKNLGVIWYENPSDANAAAGR